MASSSEPQGRDVGAWNIQTSSTAEKRGRAGKDECYGSRPRARPFHGGDDTRGSPAGCMG